MRGIIRRIRWLGLGMLLAASGCITSQQWVDFVRTELARVVADQLGQNVQTFVQATS